MASRFDEIRTATVRVAGGKLLGIPVSRFSEIWTYNKGGGENSSFPGGATIRRQAGPRGGLRLDMLQNNAVVTAVLLLVIGAVLVGEGVSGLSA